jgi:hypothetical protein
MLETEHGVKISRGTLRNVFKNQCGHTWNENFKGYGTVTHKVPELLDEFTIRAVNKILDENRRPTRTDIKNYVLNTHMRCAPCGLALSGVTRQNQSGKRYPYYHHPSGSEIKCKAFKYLPLKAAEDAIFDTIFKFTYDQAAFQKAVKERIGDRKDIPKLKKQIASKKRSLTKTENQLSRLIDLYTDSDSMTKKEYDNKRAEYKEKRANLIEKFAELEGRLQNWMEAEKFMDDSMEMREKILDEIQSPEHIKNISYDQKVDLLNYFFAGRDDNDRRYGITVQKNAQGKFEFEIYGRYILGPDLYHTIKHRPTIRTFTVHKTMGEDGFNIEKRKERISKDRYQNMSTGSGLQP